MSAPAEPFKGEVIVYEAADGQVQVDVRLERETVWLSLGQMAELFGRDKSVISRHLGNVFRSGELRREATVAKNATVQREGDREVVREVEYFNLDAILSVGYRVNSRRGTQFRIWATRTLRDHLLRGYTLNERRLRERGLGEIEQAVGLLARTLTTHALVTDEGVPCSKSCNSTRERGGCCSSTTRSGLRRRRCARLSRPPGWPSTTRGQPPRACE